MAIVRDITARRKSEAKIHHLAFYDQLTGLPNREHFKQTLRGAIRQAQGNGSVLALLYIDLDRFKRINDTFGHGLGDGLLKVVANRLKSCVRRNEETGRDARAGGQREVLARLSGDEFIVLVTDVEGEAAVATLASRLQTNLSAPFVYDRHRFVITPSIGIALFPRDGESASGLLRSADAAMYRAKAAGRNNYCFYSATMLARSLERLELENDLRSAIQRDELRVVYQPKVDLATWSIVGVEALLRWQHPTRGWIPPAEFIPVAEETGLILDLGEFVLAKACAQLTEWRARNIDISIAINVSSQQFRFGELATHVLQTIRQAGVPPQNLEIEITESLLMRNVDENIEALRLLHDAGIRLSVDDFGTGYSSLSYLKDFPLHALKIDRSFVRDLHNSRDDAAICAAILAMARELGLKVIAEGVETEEQLEFLRRHGCDEIQGFIFSKPLPPEELEVLLLESSHTANAAAPLRRSGTND